MSQPEMDAITQAQEYLRSRQLLKAQRLLVEVIKKNPNSEQAWFLLSAAVDDPRKQIECLQRVLRINPANTEAQDRLMKAMTAQAAPPPEPRAASATVPAAAGQPPAGEPAPFTPPIETPAPVGESRPVGPTVVEAVKPIEPAATTVDADLSGLRSKVKYIKPRRPRKRWPRIVTLFLLILLAAIVGGYLVWNNFNQAAYPFLEATPAGALAAPTDTPAPMDTPTVTPTPSITPTRYPPTWTPTPPPTAPPTLTPTPLPALDPAVQTGLLRLRDQVAEVRGLTATAEFPTALLPPELVESALRSVLDIQRRQPELVNQARGLAALGLVRRGFDLTRYTINRFADNAGGFYAPWQNVIDVAGKEFGGVEGIVYAHQLAHALLDRRFSTAQQGLYPACTRGDDQCQALQALVEGDAALATDRWLETGAADFNKAELPKYQALPPAIDDPAAPLFILRDTAFRGRQGRQFVETLYQKGGWAAVNKAYENLPASTEQILHPDKYLEGEKPIEVAAASLAGVFGGDWQLIADEALGEWRTYLLLSAGVDEAARLSEETAQEAAAGWGGDRYQVYYDPETDQSALVVQWAWDTPQDATEFQQAMSAYLDLRFRNARAQMPGQSCWSASRQAACLYAAENRMLWVAAPEFELVDQVRKAYPDFK